MRHRCWFLWCRTPALRRGTMTEGEYCYPPCVFVPWHPHFHARSYLRDLVNRFCTTPHRHPLSVIIASPHNHCPLQLPRRNPQLPLHTFPIQWEGFSMPARGRPPIIRAVSPLVGFLIPFIFTLFISSLISYFIFYTAYIVIIKCIPKRLAQKPR
jgi:hypothetical protein